MTAFPDTFRALVIPQLRVQCHIQAVDVVHGVTTFGDAVENLWTFARDRGATYLGPDRIDAIRDWIMSNLLTAIDNCQTIGAKLAAEQTRDPAGYYRQLVKVAPGAKWAAAAISQEYRETLKHG
jgi:hypothetical protein